jgi:hypothetical protein
MAQFGIHAYRHGVRDCGKNATFVQLFGMNPEFSHIRCFLLVATEIMKSPANGDAGRFLNNPLFHYITRMAEGQCLLPFFTYAVAHESPLQGQKRKKPGKFPGKFENMD